MKNTSLIKTIAFKHPKKQKTTLLFFSNYNDAEQYKTEEPLNSSYSFCKIVLEKYTLKENNQHISIFLC